MALAGGSVKNALVAGTTLSIGIGILVTSLRNKRRGGRERGLSTTAYNLPDLSDAAAPDEPIHSGSGPTSVPGLRNLGESQTSSTPLPPHNAHAHAHARTHIRSPALSPTPSSRKHLLSQLGVAVARRARCICGLPGAATADPERFTSGGGTAHLHASPPRDIGAGGGRCGPVDHRPRRIGEDPAVSWPGAAGCPRIFAGPD